MKWFIYTIFIVLFIGVTFFGLGPVLFADGSKLERMISFGVVILIYVVLTFFFLKWCRRRK